MKEILEFSSTFFYTDILLLGTSIFAFVASLIYYKKKEKLKLIPIYLLISILQSSFTILDFVFPNMPTIYGHSFSNVLVSVFILFEYLIITWVFYNYIESQKIRYFLKLNSIGYIISFAIYHIIFKTNRIETEHFFVIHALFILIPPSSFVYWVFRSDPLFDLKNLPPFWLTIGIYSCTLGTLPIFVIGDVIFNSDSNNLQLELFAINNISYIIFFLLIIKAYRCNQTLAA